MRIDVKKILNEFGFNELWNEQQQQIDSCTSEDIKQRMSDLTKEDIFGNIKKSQKVLPKIVIPCKLSKMCLEIQTSHH